MGIARDRSVQDLKAELRIALEPVLVLLTAPALALVLGSGSLPEPAASLGLGVLLYLLAGALWLLASLWPLVARWVTLLSLMVAVLYARYVMGISGMMTLLAIPTALAAPLVGIGATLAVAIAGSLLLILPAAGLLAPLPSQEISLGLVLIWVTVAIAYGARQPVLKLAEWSWDRYCQVCWLLEQARDRQVELKEALEALADANRELAMMNERMAALRLIAEEARKSKATFVANVSHELRTPLNVILGLADVLLRASEVPGEELPATVREDLAILYRNCEHLSSMVNDVLDLSQVEAGKLALRREWVDVGGLIDDALRIVQPLLERKGLTLQVSKPGELPLLYCDPRRIRQVILNLLSNAARHTEKGSIAVQVRHEEPYVVVSVADTGPGIAEEDAKRIFEPFEQGAGGMLGTHRGSGLGLSISRQFVEMHDGRIWLQSELGSGSTFTFKLPVSPLAGPREPVHRWISEGWTRRTVPGTLPPTRLERRMVLYDPTGKLYPVLARYTDELEIVETSVLAQAKRTLRETAAQALLINAGTPGELMELVEQARTDNPDVPIIGCSVPSRESHALLTEVTALLLKPLRRRDLERAIREAGRPVRRVLLADDDPDAVHTLVRMLRGLDSGLEIITAADGKETLDAMRKQFPDLVLLDLMMPRVNGWEVLAARVKEQALSQIPVIVITAQDPKDEPISSRVVVGTMGAGLSLSKLLRSSQAVASLLMQPD